MLRKYKHFMIGFLVGALLFSLSPVFAEGGLNIMENPFPIFINGKMERVEGYNINGYTFLKLADFGKAGLVVKFNETEKRIEIESVIKSSNERGGDKIVEESIPIEGATIEKDGYNLMVVNGIEYVSLKEVYEKYEGKYRFNPLDGEKAIRRAAIMLIDNTTDEHITAIPNQYTIKTNEKTYIVYSYFLEHVLPEIAKEGN
jgi:hypothetical protein